MKFHLNPKKALEESRSLRAAPEQDDTGLILVANGISGSSIKLFADHVRVTEIKNHKVTEFPIKNIVALNYLKHFTPIGITLTYLENGKNLKATVSASPTKRIEFDAMEKRIKQMMADGGETMQPQQPQVSAYDELAKLAALRDQGVVTEQEFQEQKAKLLGTQTSNQSKKRFDPQTGRPL
ncbi:MAG: SHOCT domain-containing protein [Halobacteriota archaeon]